MTRRRISNMMVGQRLREALWRIYDRPQPGKPWRDGGNFPWDEPSFSERMLREHLDQSHGAASRPEVEIDRLVEVMWGWLNLWAGATVLDVTCGPGLYAVRLARRGCRVHGIDISPASIRYAQELAEREGVADRCRFTLADIREALPRESGVGYDAALFLYGQLAVFPRQEAASLLKACAQALRPGGRLLLELLNFEKLDRRPHSSWWYTDRGGLWGDFPYLHLGERDWDEELQASIERYFIINLETGELHTYALADQGYPVEEVIALCHEAGFARVDVHPAWDGTELYDADEWIAYVVERET
ncbi:MAG TPA: methyltransferase domain-containing protein [Caldilineae bacterium]|nr:methyltransferase domain-containing protein [Caldilineae bacterium]